MYIGILICIFFHLKLSCTKHNYLLFENFELTRINFIEEQMTFRNLKHERNQLYKVALVLKSIGKIGVSVQPISNLENMISNASTKMNQEFVYGPKTVCSPTTKGNNAWEYSFLHKLVVKNLHNFTFSYEEVYKDWETIEIVKSALRGLLMLRETFDQNITEFSAGRISVKKREFGLSRKIDALIPEDMAVLSKLAYNDFNYYDSAIEYLKTAVDMLRGVREDKNVFHSKQLKDRLLEMRKTYPSYHNELLEKLKRPIGNDWKLYPYKVDQGAKKYNVFQFMISEIRCLS